MNYRITRLYLLIPLFLLTVLACNDNGDATAGDDFAPLESTRNSPAFTRSYATLLNDYYTLRDAFVAADTSAINQAAALLSKSSTELNAAEAGGDTTGTIRETAEYFISNISNAANQMLQEQDLGEKREEFYQISDALWSLTRTVQYDREKVYYQYCPMAFDNRGAYWLSADRKVVNPYFGSDMLHCGEVSDSLDYSQR